MSLSLENIARLAYDMADVPFPDEGQATPFLTETGALVVINMGLGELHDLLVEVYEDYLTRVDTSLSMVSGERTTNPPGDFFKLRALFLVDSGQRVELYPFDPLDAAGTTTTDTTDRPRYRIVGNKLYWHELPGSAYPLEVWYVRQFIPLVDIEDTIDPVIPETWEIYVVGYLANYLLAKEESDTTSAEKVMAKARQRIVSAATNRDASRPQQVRDTRGRFDQHGRRGRWNRRLPYPRA